MNKPRNDQAPAPEQDDRAWREHQAHVPREFEQGSRRADYRRRGDHASTVSQHEQERRWPRGEPDAVPGAVEAFDAPVPADGRGIGARRAPAAPGARAGGSIGSQGYPGGSGHADSRRRGPRPPAALQRENLSDGHFHGTEAYANTSGYDDYESEAVFGNAFGGGDWPRVYARASGRGPDGHHPRDDHRGRGPSGYARSDERILEDVVQRLTDDPDVDARGLQVAVDGGIVRIDGEVRQRWIKHHVEHLAANCMGVADVDNRVRVRRGG